MDWDGYRLLLDLGYATLPRLLAHWPDGAVDAVVVTHEHLEAGGVALAYTGDTGPTPALAELGRDADLFIVEATDRDGETDRPTRNLLTSAEAGHWARRAGARRLMLTHFWPGNDRAASMAAAREEFGGEVLAAEEGLHVTLGDTGATTRQEPGHTAPVGSPQEDV
ncbi:MBL fold metallo-hydrolase [Sphaerisporangium sp. TRM90804]|uniref:MBL fold metallo-hydrolase n=1 Tax=Sphaerisporangium sp. TRM90804 TaxID=3031113 RepID=UPI002449124E|nr:MBL fold metallo-hydrolase [Sphaerisporangium sp. TRM90804]MDH2428403.1 MBL fold metallo-hydrolase [Sphaerisporangium sp. TRM90804]